jgi:hypothetical protein
MIERAGDRELPDVDAVVVAYGNQETIRACVGPLGALRPTREIQLGA